MTMRGINLYKISALLLSLVVLNACQTPEASRIDTKVREWPEPVSDDANQREIVIYINKGHAAYKSCKAAIGEK